MLFSKLESQDNNERNICCCSNVIQQISDGWKKDSTRLSEYRFNNYEKLLSCKIDTVSLLYVRERLGKPESVGYSNKQIDYEYYFFDRNSLSKKNLEDIIGIILRFNKDNNQLLETELILNDF